MENYQYGTMFVVINLSYVLSTPVAAYLIIPVFYRLKTASVYEYLELRFGYATRLAASLSFSLQMVLYMGIVVYAPALALEAVTGLNQVFSIVIVGVVCTFYATLGGMKAVLITDIYQSLLMFAAVFSVIICAWVKAGSLEEIWRVAQENGRIDLSNFSVDPTERHTWFTQILGGSATYLAIYGVNQAQVQRLMAVRSLTQFPHNKKDIKLRPEDLRRWDEDDDMSDMTTTVRVSTTPLAPNPNTKHPTNVIPFRL